MINKKGKFPASMAAIVVCSLLSLAGCGETTSKEVASDTTAEQAELKSIPKVSVQLYSVRDALKQDFEGTLQKIADMGFDGVEFAGYFGRYSQDPKALKSFLDSIGLKVSGAHVPIEQLQDQYEKTVDFYRALDTHVLIVPSEERAFDKEGVTELAKEFTNLSEKLKNDDMKTGFHNHEEEWASYDGNVSFIDYIATHTPESFVLQQDVGWTLDANHDPVAFVQKYAGRVLTTHFKSVASGNTDALPIIGKDNIEWAEIYKATVNDGGAKWIVVEQEEYPNGMTQIQALAASKHGFDTILANLK